MKKAEKLFGKMIFGIMVAVAALSVVPLSAEEVDESSESPYQSGVEFGAGLVFSTQDFDKENTDLGSTAGLDVFLSRNFALTGEVTTYDKDEKEIDRVGGGIKLRAPLGDIKLLDFMGKFSDPFAIGTAWGYGWTTETRTHRGYAGLYLEARYKHVGIQAGGRLDVDLESFGQDSAFVFPVTFNVNF